MIDLSKPILLNETRVWRTYKGGKELDRISGKEQPADSAYPESWMFSTTLSSNPDPSPDEGLCFLADDPGTSLKQLVEENPMEMLGEAHAKTWGTSLGVLIKLLDSAERLTIQVHPDKDRAQKYFQSPFGKTESWHILSTRDDQSEEACVYLGFKEGITEAQWREVFHAQDIENMLSLLHRIPVKAGDTFIVEAGVPHAIGSGCLILEIQEPTDFTIRTERITPSGQSLTDQQCHQGLGFNRMFDCFDYEGITLAEAKDRWLLPGRELDSNRREIISYADTDCFKAEWLKLSDEYVISSEAKYRCLYIRSGKGTINLGNEQRPIEANQQYFIPASATEFSLIPESNLEAYLIHGPK